VNRKQIRGFAELEFIAKAENIVFVGKTDRRSRRGVQFIESLERRHIE
jgi:hypothetical protein